MLGPGQRVDTLRPYVIDPIEVTPDGGEDPAMRIMRMAIASAPYFRTQVAEYTADVYIKGSFNVGKLSRVVRRLSGGNFRDIREGTTYVDEALSEVVFTAPNHYVQKVKRRSSSLPDELAGGDPMRLINISIYDPVSIAISPLSPGAFGHYRFVYEGYSVDGDKVINRIRVTPVHRSSELLTGWLHIVEGDWSVRAFDLSGEVRTVAGVRYRLRASFGEVASGVWMPVSHNMTMDLSALGSKAQVRYVASVDYTRLVESASGEHRPEPDGVVRTNRDANRMARRERKRELPSSLDITERLADNYSVEIDTTVVAGEAPTWDMLRPVPLRADEVRGYRHSRVSAINGEGIASDSVRRKRGSVTVSAGMGRVTAAVTGRKEIGNRDKGGALVWRGVVPSRVGFNTVDGFYLGFTPVEYVKRFSAGTDLRLSPDVGWAVNREAFVWRMDARLRFAPLHRGELTVSAGNGTRNFSGSRNIDNTFPALFFRRNYLKLYQDKFVEVAGTIDIANGLVFSGGLRYSDRRMLDNSTHYSIMAIGGRDYTPNVPVNAEGVVVPVDHKAAIMTLGLEFTPQYYYRVRDGRKDMVRSPWPTFFASWKKGLKGLGGSVADFNHFSFGVKQNVALGGMRQLDYFIQSGFFTQARGLFFGDFRHFGATDFPLTGSPITSSNLFHMLPRYMYSTSGAYVDAHFYYRAPVILIKQIPWFGRRLWEESLQFNYLYTKALHNYVEVGYTVGLIWQVGVFAGFDNFRYRDFSLRVSVPLKLFFQR